MTVLVRERVTEFLEPRLRGIDLADDDDIFGVAHINSLFAVQLVRFVEREFSVDLDPEDMEFENFRTIGGICELVRRKTGA